MTDSHSILLCASPLQWYSDIPRNTDGFNTPHQIGWWRYHMHHHKLFDDFPSECFQVIFYGILTGFQFPLVFVSLSSKLDCFAIHLLGIFESHVEGTDHLPKNILPLKCRMPRFNLICIEYYSYCVSMLNDGCIFPDIYENINRTDVLHRRCNREIPLDSFTAVLCFRRKLGWMECFVAAMKEWWAKYLLSKDTFLNDEVGTRYQVG